MSVPCQAPAGRVPAPVAGTSGGAPREGTVGDIGAGDLGPGDIGATAVAAPLPHRPLSRAR